MYPTLCRKKTYIYIYSTTPLPSDNIYPLIKNITNKTQNPTNTFSYKTSLIPHTNRIINNNTKPHNNKQTTGNESIQLYTDTNTQWNHTKNIIPSDRHHYDVTQIQFPKFKITNKYIDTNITN